jgi:hypothetical protein
MLRHFVRLVSLKRLLQTRNLTRVSLQRFIVLVLPAAYKLLIPFFFVLFHDTLSTSNIRCNASFSKVSENALRSSVLESRKGH